MKEAGLTVDLLEDMDRFIRINNLQECTDPIFINKHAPTAKGVLSYEIFGTSQEDRKHKMAYIDLHGHYMYPLAAIKLASYDRKLSNVLFARGRWKLTPEGELVEDENGKAGPEYLYSIWGKVKVKEKTTVTTQEIETFFKQSRDFLFTTKYPVIPPFTRDINIHTNSMTKSSNKLNSWYSNIISYTQSMQQYTDIFANYTYLTQARVQGIINEIYQDLMVVTVKGQPSKYGMMRRFMQGKNIDYSARLVITAPILLRESFEDVQAKFGYAVIPLAYVLSCFFPFMIHHLKAFFDAAFIQNGNVLSATPDSNKTYTFTDSYDETEITKMINKYINSSASRFEPLLTPLATDGKRHHIKLEGRFMKDNTVFSRPATLTDVLYIVAKRVVADKHVFVTRYPLDNYNGQFPAKIEISTTIKTHPVAIGENVYQFFPIVSGDPANSFTDTLQFSNTYLDAMGGDYDGDTVSIKPIFTMEANDDAEKRIRSNAYILNIEGELIRNMTKDFLLCEYNLTRTDMIKEVLDSNVNVNKTKYAV